MPSPTPAELSAASQRLRDVLKTRLPRGDYDDGSVLSDLVVDAHTIVYADLSKQNAELRARQSLLALQNAPAGVDADEATDAILSNLFVSRDVGNFARGVGTIHFTQRVDTLIPRNARFFKTSALVFYLNAAADLLVQATQMRPVFDSTGAVSTWAYDVPLIAARTGSAYRATRGRFANVDAFSPYVAYVENVADFAGGLDVETSRALVPRANTALSLRALINDRSNDARLREAFTEITRVFTIGMGEPEMIRDTLVATAGIGVPLHLGAYADIYVELPLQQVTERLVIEEPTARPDGKILTLRDSSPPSGSFVTAGVLAGDALVLAAGLPEAPLHFRIQAVRATELDLVPAVPFSRATDEDDVPPNLTYSVGNNYPTFDNHVAATVSASARTSRLISREGCVVLPAHPIYAISRVEILSPPPALATFADPTTGTVLYPIRRNGPWPRAPVPGEPLSYRVICTTPESAQSARALNFLELAWPGLVLTDTEVLVTYETPVGFASIQELLSSRRERVLAANNLARAPHPVYVGCSIGYRGRTLPTGLGSTVGVVNEAAVTAAVIAQIETTGPGELDRTELLYAAHAADPNLGPVYAFSIFYELLLPDGRVAKYSTGDLVQLVPSPTSSAILLNAAELDLPVDYLNGLIRLLADQGVSDRVVKYRSDSSRVTMERRS